MSQSNCMRHVPGSECSVLCSVPVSEFGSVLPCCSSSEHRGRHHVRGGGTASIAAIPFTQEAAREARNANGAPIASTTSPCSVALEMEMADPVGRRLVMCLDVDAGRNDQSESERSRLLRTGCSGRCRVPAARDGRRVSRPCCYIVRRRRRDSASVMKKIRLTASTTAPPVGTRSLVEMTRPPAPARKATTTLHAR